MESTRGQGSYNSNFDAVNSALKKLSADMANSKIDTTELQASIDKLMSGGTSSLILRGDSHEAPRVKVRFVGQDYQKKIHELNKEMASLSPNQRQEPMIAKFEKVLNLFTDQVEKEQIIFKVTSPGGKSQYSAPQRVMEQMKTGGVVSLDKSGQEKVYITGQQQQQQPELTAHRRVRVIEDISVVNSEQLATTIEILREAIAHLRAEMRPEITVEEKPKEKAVTSTIAQASPKPTAAQTQKEKKIEHEHETKKEVRHEAKQKKTEVSSEERTFVEKEKAKDRAAKIKQAMIEETEEAKEEIRKKETDKKIKQ